MGIHFIDICEREAQHQPPTEIDLLRDEVERLKAKRAYDAWHIRHIRRILHAIDMPTSPQGTLSKLAIASPAWRVLLLAKTALGLCDEVTQLNQHIAQPPAESAPITVAAIAQDPAWTRTDRGGVVMEVYRRLDAPVSIDFGDAAQRPGVPYLTNGIEVLELPGLTNLAALNAFVAGFNSRKSQVPA